MLLEKVIDGIQVRKIIDFPDYWISSHGAIWKNSAEKWISQRAWAKGRRKVKLRNGIVTEQFYTYQLVALCWIGNPLEDKSAVLHSNDDFFDNCVLNLSYGAHKENAEDRRKNGNTASGSRNGRSKLTEEDVLEILVRLSRKERGSRLAKEFDVSRDVISRIKKREIWTHVELPF